MRLLLVWPIALSGWVLAGLYIFYERSEFGAAMPSHLLAYDDMPGLIFHVFMLGAPFMSTFLGYMVNERIKLMGSVRDLEARYRDYYENAPMAYHSVSPDQIFVEVNNTWLGMLGYEREEVIGRMRLSELIPPEWMQRFASYYGEFTEKGVLDSTEMVLLKKDGTQVPVMFSSTMMRDGQGKFVRTRTIVRDISERKAYESALMRAAEEWKSTFDSMPWGVMLIDREYNILRANEYVSKMSSTTIRNILECKCYEILHRTDRPIENCPHSASMNSGEPRMVEYHDELAGKYYRIFCSPVRVGSEVKALVHSLVDITDIRQNEKKLIDSRNAFFNMLKDISVANKELGELYNGLIYAFANAIDAKSHWTKGHSERVSRFAVSIAQDMNMSKSDVDRLRTAALLHDIGKIGTYDYLLDKPEKLTQEEYEIVKEHPLHSARILEPISQLGEIIEVIKFHHERWDGRGYPIGLRGRDIPLMARILCVADSFDSMTADRPYRPAPGIEYAVKELKECSGTHFDPEIVEVFLRILQREGHLKERYFFTYGSN